MKFNANDFYLGTTEDNLVGLFLSYSKKLSKASNKEICGNVVHLIWNIATFTTDYLCPSCQESNLRISSSTDHNHIYETCDNCLTTFENGEFVERPDEMIPATKKEVDDFLINAKQ
ncbi:hypothetical protein [Xylocopilactobacillus apicola]|nr:hypothetical protein [Xylocopilactobacillus apicola]